MLERAVFPLPANVSHHQSALQQVVGTKLHLPLKLRDVGSHHPLEERTHRASATNIASLYRIGTDVGSRKSGHEDSNVAIDALIDDVCLVVSSTIPRKRIRPMLTKIVRLARPDVAAIVIAVAALVKVKLQIVRRAVERIDKCFDVRGILNVGQGFGVIFVNHFRMDLR